MVDLSKFKSNDDDVIFFLYDKNNLITERWSIWGSSAHSTYSTYEADPIKTKHNLYHYVGDGDGVDEHNINDVNIEGIEIVWNGNPFNVDISKDYYRVIKRK